MDHSYFTRWFVLVELCGLCASQDSQLRLMPSPGQAYGATARISVEFPLVSFVNNFYIASERVYQVSYASPDFLLPAASESSYKTRISESAAIGPSSVSVFLNISNLAQTEVGKTMFVRDTTNAVVSQVAFNITECPNITTNGIVTRYSLSPCGVGCVGNFTCTSGYIKASITANCREDATWSANPITMGLCKSGSPKGLSGGEIAGIVIGCLIAVVCIGAVVYLFVAKKACFADKADKNPHTEGPACTPLNENQPKNPDSSNDNLSSDRV